MALPNYERPIIDAETRARLQKPAKGTAIIERRQKRAQTVADEKAVKAAVTARDGVRVCRLDPACEFVRKNIRIEGVHLDSKGMAGDHGERTRVELMLRGCHIHHQGARSIHSGDLRVKYLTPAKANAPIALERKVIEFTRNHKRIERWEEFAREAAIGIWETKR
jgi:hypothetical protein